MNNDLIARAKEMCDPPQPCIYGTLAWRKVVLELVSELVSARHSLAAIERELKDG